MKLQSWRDLHGATIWPYLLLIPIISLWPWWLSRVHYTLPTPLPPYGPDGRPQASEHMAVAHMQALEDIGYRTVGTEEALAGEQYVLDQVNQIASRCRLLECEVAIQKGSGYHSFNILDHDILKVYSGIRNIILRISTPGRNSSNALLLGSHIDSTLPSPGAADDGIGVGVMLDIARVLVDRDEPFDNSIIFMWNGAEETLQDGSHMYSTQHPSAKDIKAVINLEAAGTTGGALLFQATSKEMIEAFSHAPHPRGTVAAADVFASGIILSDTDFGQFEQYLGVSGLDMAIVGHSYFYHTRGDIVKNIQKGSAQHFGDNVLAVVDHLLTSNSALATGSFTPPNMVYLSLFDIWFFSWNMATADKAYAVIAVLAFTVTLLNVSLTKSMLLTLIGAPLGLVAGLLSANALAGLLVAIDKRQLWFSHEHLPLVMYVPAGFLGHLGLQYLLSRYTSPAERHRLESYHYHAQLLFSTTQMVLMQIFRIRSAYIFAGITCFMLTGVVGRGVWRYVMPLGLLAAGTVEAVTSTLDIFTPLTGRMGKDAPSEFIIATLSVAVGFVMAPTLVPLFHRLPRRTQAKVLVALATFQSLVILILASPLWSPYDSMHPKRIALQYHYNHTSGLSNAHVAFMDMAGNKAIVDTLHSRYGAGPLQSTTLTEYDSDWDVLYPLPDFLETWHFPISPSSESRDFKFPKPLIKHTELPFDGTGVRRLKFKFDFTGLVWPVLAFEAEVVDWSFNFPPPKGLKRHHLKIVASIDTPIVDFELDIRTGHGSEPETGVKQGKERLDIHYSALDLNQMVPGTAGRRGPDMPMSRFLTEVDNWAKEKWNGGLDFVMCGTVAGVVTI